MENDKCITLMGTVYKIYADILRRRLDEKMEKDVLNDIQMGFRKEREAMDAV